MSQSFEDQIAFWKNYAFAWQKRAEPIRESELQEKLRESETKTADLKRQVERMEKEGASRISPRTVIKYGDRLYLTAKAYIEVPKDRAFITGEESITSSKLFRQVLDWNFMRRNHWQEVEWEKDPYLGVL